MKPTTRGWALLAVAVGSYAGGRTLGVVELSMLAAGAALALGTSALLVGFGRAELSVRRSLHPHRLHAATPGRAEIAVTNTGRRRTPLLAVSDRFEGRPEVRFAVPPLGPRDSARGAFALPTGRRGVFTLGPLTSSVTDPLGLVHRALRVHSPETITVYPRIEVVRPLPPTAGRDLVGGSTSDFSRSRAGHEFHGLREYATGDDLRRVHWRSTARTGQLMIREHDVPWQTRASLLVDERRDAFDTESFERTVSAAASVASALQRQRAIARLLTTGSGETGFGAGTDRYQTVFERLAVLERVDGDDVDRVVARLHRHGGAGALVAFVGSVHDDDVRRLRLLTRSFGLVAILRFDRRAPRHPPAPFVAPGLLVAHVPPNREFADVWAEAISTYLVNGRRRRVESTSR